MRYAVSGANTDAIEPATGAVQSVIGRDLPSTRAAFWLTWIGYIGSGTGGYVYLYDATAGATVGSGTLRATLQAATAVDDRPFVIKFPSPGLKFTAGCCAAFSASGTIAAGGMYGGGFEE
jgi:hypothetical protein